jgi:hypothetical protein
MDQGKDYEENAIYANGYLGDCHSEVESISSCSDAKIIHFQLSLDYKKEALRIATKFYLGLGLGLGLGLRLRLVLQIKRMIWLLEHRMRSAENQG